MLGGVAVRLNLTFENLDDLEVALAALLEREDAEGAVTVTVRIADRTIETIVGPFRGDGVRTELEREPAPEDMSLRRVLATVVDDVDLTREDDGDWVRLTKRVHRASEGTG